MSRPTKSRPTPKVYTPKYLGNKKAFSGLDPIPLKPGKTLTQVTLTSEEVTAQCPLTGQPDFYKVEIDYSPHEFLAESKSVKLWLQSFREKGIFAETFAVELAERFQKEIKPYDVEVTVTQTPRGGVGLKAFATCSDGQFWKDVPAPEEKKK